MTLAAGNVVGPSETAFIIVLVTMTLLIVIGATILVQYERRLRREAEHALRTLQTRTDTTEDRDSVMFLQHRAMNDLQMAKLAAEVQILQAQLSHRTVDTDRLEAGKEAHELMVEKMRLEMDSLRLHIAEQRRRGEDWNSNDI